MNEFMDYEKIKIKDYLTVGCQNKLVKIAKKYEEEEIEYDYLRERENCLIEGFVTEVNGEKDNILERVLNLKAREYKLLLKTIDDILKRDEELESIIETQYWSLTRNGKGKVCSELSHLIIIEKMHWDWDTFLKQPSWLIESLKTKFHLDNKASQSKIKHR